MLISALLEIRVQLEVLPDDSTDDQINQALQSTSNWEDWDIVKVKNIVVEA